MKSITAKSANGVKPLKFNPEEPIVRHCCALGQMGLYGKVIAADTGFSLHEVYQCLKEHGIKLRSYREGNSKGAKWIRNAAAQFTGKQLEARIRTALEA